MLYVGLACFLFALIAGLFLFSFFVQKKSTPKKLVVLHGILALTGITLLFSYTYSRHPSPLLSLILCLFAATGGFIILFRDLTQKHIPLWFPVIHGLMGFMGIVALTAFLLNI